jgi:hydroxymethylpyrimidine pyrophosphatase-like HAD family hydrolase
VIEALGRLRASGRKLILITGRELDELLSIFAPVEDFDLVVAENGALLYRPGKEGLTLLGPPPEAALIEELRRREIPMWVGRCIVGTVRPHHKAVAEVIRSLGLRLQIVFNKESVMVMPEEVDKGTGLLAGLQELNAEAAQTAGIGDAENDYAFLRHCGFSVAVANAIPGLKQQVHAVSNRANGRGVTALIEQMIAKDGFPKASRL